jgi:amino acid adenylation domain-containing protein
LRINAPKGELTASLRARIARHKSELLVLLREREAKLPGELSSLLRLPCDRPSPLSFAQERLWFLEALEPGLSVYNLCRAARITGPLQVAALEKSLGAILDRHQVLRAKFLTIDGRPLQVAVAAERIALSPVDLRGFSPAARERKTGRILVEESQRPFDLAEGRMLRALLLRLNDAEHMFAVSTHHLVADAWSMGILFGELWIFYEAFLRGRAPALPALSIQYRDYALWQRDRFRRDTPVSELDYWKQRLAGLPALDLPADRPRPPRQSYRGGRQGIEFPETLTAALNEMSRREGATLFMTLLAAFQLLLYRYSGQEDFAVGSPAANRDRVEVEGLIGLFVNTLVLRADLSGGPSFRELLRRVREASLAAYQHQKIPFEKLVEELNPPRELGRHPLFQTMFVLQNTPGRSATPPDLTLAPIEVDNQTSQFDLSLYLRERAGRLIGFFEYAADLFEDATVERLARHFQTLLESIVANPERSIAALPVLAAAERRQLLIEWNDTAADYPRDACLHHLFEAQVERTPEAAALECDGNRLTYRELNRRANRLARRLKRLGVGPEVLVGVLAERSLETVVSLLAVLKAGGAYVPLDPSYPQERLAFMLADARVGILLCQKKWATLIAADAARLLYIDELAQRGGEGGANLESGTTPDNAAYVIYTSGSTGTPKGAVGLHRGAVNRCCWMWQAYPFAPGDIASHKTPLSFVDSVWEIFGALLQGVPSAIVPEAVAREPELLVRRLAERKVTRLVAVPSLLKAIFDQCPDAAKQLRRLKICISSGEALPVNLAGRFRAALPGCRLINLYGSSEVAGDVACYEVSDELEATIPIGRPIHNTRIYVLDPNRHPVPVGVSGEIYVGGENLARGYLHGPELTAEKFVADPFVRDPGSILYRTGDLGRYRADGNIEFLGRVDNQVEIRGCRIEPGEVEAALMQHPAVKETVVIASDVTRGEAPPSRPSPVEGEGVSDSDRRLVAYLVCHAQVTSINELRSFLKEKLPDFMVPSAFVTLDALPMTPNGKIDRVALTGLRGRKFKTEAVEAEAIEARSESEALVAQLWRQELKLKRVGVNENFFQLGGHSLLAAKMASQLRTAVGKDISIADIFRAPTVAGLAELIEKKLRGEAEPELPAIVAGPQRRLLPLSLSQKRLFVFSRLLGGDFLNMPYAYRLEGRLDLPALRLAVQEIVRRHAVLRSGFVDADDEPRQFVRYHVKVKIPLIDLSGLGPERESERVERLSHADAVQCFDLEKPPLLRVKILRLSADKHLLLVTMHHLVTDQWSMGVFRKELGLLYAAFSSGLTSPLTNPAFQFSDFVLWQHRLLSAGALSRSLDYCMRQLGEPSPRLDFHGTERPRKKARYHSTRKPFEVDDGLFTGIRSFAADKNCTPFMVFLTGLFVWVHRLTGESDVRIATLVANRTQPGTEGLIGYFVNAVVLRARVLPKLSLQELLEQVREVCLSAYAHAEVPFEFLEDLLEKQHRHRGAPLYQVMLNYRNLSTPAHEAIGLTIASWEGKIRAGDPGVAISRLDVEVHLREVSTKLTGAVNFRSDLFDDAGMERFLGGYSSLLHQVIAYPERRISRLSLG